MTRSVSYALVAVFLVAACGCHRAREADDSSVAGTETIIILRHGEKAEGGLGQLDCKGLNRSLALPRVLIGRFGRPAAIFAPNPSVQMKEGIIDWRRYSYVRPLATIAPTAIQLGLPVNTQIGYSDIAALQQAVTAAPYANSTVFVAWEHWYAYMLARQLMSTYGQDPAAVPQWPGDDYDTLYVFLLTRRAGVTPSLVFAVQQQGLAGTLPDTCPVASAGVQP